MSKISEEDLSFSERMSDYVDSSIKSKIPDIQEIKRTKSGNSQSQDFENKFTVDGIIKKIQG